MFMNISIEFDESRKYPVTLIFEEQGSLDIDLELKKRKEKSKKRTNTNMDTVIIITTITE